jgi:hypothetical protein
MPRAYLQMRLVLIAEIIGHKFSDYLGQIEEFPLYTDL